MMGLKTSPAVMMPIDFFNLGAGGACGAEQLQRKATLARSEKSSLPMA